MAILSEADGRQLLFDKFTAAGFAIRADVAVDVDGHTLELDGWDDVARVGYEFLSLNDHKRAQYTHAAMDSLARAIDENAMFVFVFDVEQAATRVDVAFAVDAFLAEVGKRRLL
jgi:hypothetical protein